MNKQLHGLTIIRGFAALWVALHHGFLSLEAMVLPENSFFHNLILRGWLGVDLFFILSGFIMYHSNASKVSISSFNSIKTFVVKRFARIYPAHIFVLGLYLIVVYGARYMGAFSDPDGLFSVQKFTEQVFLLNGLGIFEPVGWNAPSWSISSEFLAYSLFPLLLVGLSYFRSAVGILLLFLSILLPNIWFAQQINVGQQYMLSFEFVSLRVLSEFTLGMGLYKLNQKINLKRFSIPMVMVSVAAILLHSFIENSFFDFFYLLYFMVLIAGLSNLNIKKVEPLVLMGEISFCYYLIHSLVIICANQLIRKSDILISTPYLGLLFFVIVSAVVAYFLHNYVEKPGRQIALGMLKIKGALPWKTSKNFQTEIIPKDGHY